MSGKFRKALDVLKFPPSNRKIMLRARRAAESKKTPVVALAARLFVAGAFVIGQPVVAEPTPDVSVRASGDAFAALQDFVQTQRVLSLNFAQAPKALQSSAARDPYSVLSDFVRVADASGTVPLPAQAQGQAPDDAIHSKLHGAGSGGGAYGPDASPGPAQGPTPDDAIHSAVKASFRTASDDYAALRDFAAGKDDAKPIVVAVVAAKPAKVKKPGPAADAEPAAGEFAKGDPQVCLGCHGQDPHIQAFLKYSSMARKGDQRTPMAGGGCESCHGPSAAHVASRSKGGDVEPAVVFSGPHASPVEQRNEVCMNCHEGGLRINWVGSKMQNDGVACVNCHAVHVAKDPVLVKKTQPGVCFACHAQQRAESLEYSHHPIQEGLVVCSDCHNPHGSAGPHALKEFSVNETCYNCHQDKRGPMLWEHQPVREDCTNCHMPHGSVEERLLRENPGFMCSSCHSSTAANHSGGAFGGANALPGNLQGKAVFNSALGNQRLCLNCHSQVHGSNSPNGAYFFR